MAVGAQTPLGDFSRLPPEILQMTLHHTHATDDQGGMESGLIEFVHNEDTDNFHHARLMLPIIKEVGVGYFQSHRALCLVSKATRQESEDVLFRKNTINLVFGADLEDYHSERMRVENRVGELSVPLKYLEKHARHINLYRFVPLPHLSAINHYPSFWIGMHFSLPRQGKAADPSYTIGDTVQHEGTLDEEKRVEQQQCLQEQCTTAFRRVREQSLTSRLTVEGLEELIMELMAEDEEMENGRIELQKLMRTRAFKKSVEQRRLEDISQRLHLMKSRNEKGRSDRALFINAS